MIEAIFEIGINCLEVWIALDFLTRFFGVKEKGIKTIVGFATVWVISAATLTVMNHLIELETFGSFLFVAFYFIYALLFLQGRHWLKLWMSFFTHLLMYGGSVLTVAVSSAILGVDTGYIINVFGVGRIMTVLISKVMQFCVTRVVLRMKLKKPLTKSQSVMFIIIPAISILSLGFLLKATLYNAEIRHYIIMGMAGIVLADVVTYYFFTVMNKEYENTINAKIIEQQNENLKHHIADNEAFVTEMKAVRHDIKNQLFTIVKYIDEGKSEEAKQYIGTLTSGYLPSVLNYIQTEHAAFDAVINAKIALCSQKHIFIQVIAKKGTVITLAPEEIGVLFGNLLDNAIEAAQKTEEKRITVELQTVESYLVLQIKNSIAESVLSTNKELKTSKKEKHLHGIGIKSVKNVVTKHNGMLQFYEEENQFCCHVMLENE